MKTHTTTKSLCRNLPVFAQLLQLIPPGLADCLASEAEIKPPCFLLCPPSLLPPPRATLHAFNLNEICDAEQVHRNKLFRIRGSFPAKRITFSNANRT
jgi:hypothetical protein